VQSLLVNGTAATATFLPASFVTSGGTLDFTMGGTPNTSWGTGAADAPPSFGSTTAIGFAQTGTLVIAPSQQVSAVIGAQSTRTDVSQTVAWQLASTASTAVGITPTTGSLSLATGAQATQTLTVTAPATQGQYMLPFQLTSSTSIAMPSPTITVIVAAAGSIWPYFNNAGISDDSTGTANFDGDGYSYSAEALATAGATPGGKVTVGSVSFNWPNVAAGALDNIAVGGQTISFNETATKSTISFLGSATNAVATGATGTVTVNYADGTTQSLTLTLTDWTKGGGGGTIVAGNTAALTCAYRDGGTTKDNTMTYVWAVTQLLTNTASTVTSVTLPATVSGGVIHLFDIEID
jgi:hypothetical protein